MREDTTVWLHAKWNLTPNTLEKYSCCCDPAFGI
jgi:hypothetical protein